MATDPSSPRKKSRGNIFGLNRTPSPLTAINTTTASEETLNAQGKAESRFSRKKSPIPRLSSPFAHLRSSRSEDENDSQRNQSEDAATPSSSSAASDVASIPHPSSPSQPESPRNSFTTRPSLGKRGNRPSSVFGSLISLRFGNEEDTPPSSANSIGPKMSNSVWKEIGGKDDLTDIGKNRIVLHNGEVQTSSGWLFKKREYLVLTETHLIRYKNSSKAMENFPGLPVQRGDLTRRHTSSQSIESVGDSYSATSDTSGEKANAIPLDQIVSVYLNDERPLQNVEFYYLDTATGQSSSLTLCLGDIEDRDTWLQSLRHASNEARLLDTEPVSRGLTEYAARLVEREEDYDVRNFRIYKIIRHTSRSSGRVSADESSKTASVPCLFALGAYKAHFIDLPRSAMRGSTPSLVDLGQGRNHGILSLTWAAASDKDDMLYLTFRYPFKRPRSYQLSSLASVEIVRQLRQRDRALRPEWVHNSFNYQAPLPFEDDGPRSTQHKELGGWADVFTAFCMCYNASPSIFRYAVDYNVEDAPHFILYPPDRPKNSHYTSLELLALLRSLRYNEFFVSISFATKLDSLNGCHDMHGSEFVSHFQKNGSPVGIPVQDQERASLLVSELRALATSNPKLRRLDFSGAITGHLSSSADSDGNLPGSGVVEALYPICKKQSTNVDWFAFNYVPLTELDVEYLTGLVATKACHVRGVELSGCGLTEQNLNLILDTLKTQSNTLEALDISRNPVRLEPYTLKISLHGFNFIRRLDLSYLALSASTDPLIDLETLRRWRLEDLRLSGTVLNKASVDSICEFLRDKQSEVLKSLILNGCGLNGSRAADVLEAMTSYRNEVRVVTLDISENPLTSHPDNLVAAIAQGLTPTFLAMRELEYDEDDDKFAEMLFALAQNKTIKALDIARISLAAEVSPVASTALGELFRTNTSITDLDISGEDSRLEHAHLGKGILKALNGLKENRTLQVLRIQHQKLGLPGASVLADILRENKTLLEVHCEHNDITLSGFTDIVNSLAINHSILHIPALEEGRDSQLRHTEMQIRAARTRADGSSMNASNKVSSMRRTIARMSRVEPMSPDSVPPVPQWTQQDVQAALRLVTESWEGQVERLYAFLDRNNRIANGESPETFLHLSAEFQRPGTAGSFSKILDKIGQDRTPREEKYVELVDGGLTETTPNSGATPHKNSTSGRILLNMSPSNPMAAAAAASQAQALGSSTQSPSSSLSSTTRTLNIEDHDNDTTPVFEKHNPFDMSAALTIRDVPGGDSCGSSRRAGDTRISRHTQSPTDARKGIHENMYAHIDENNPPPPPPKDR